MPSHALAEKSALPRISTTGRQPQSASYWYAIYAWLGNAYWEARLISEGLSTPGISIRNRTVLEAEGHGLLGGWVDVLLPYRYVE